MDHWSTFDLLCRVCGPSTGSAAGKAAILTPTPSGISGSSGTASVLPPGFESRVHMFAGAATLALILLTIGFPRNIKDFREQLAEEQLAEEQLAEEKDNDNDNDNDNDKDKDRRGGVYYGAE